VNPRFPLKLLLATVLAAAVAWLPGRASADAPLLRNVHAIKAGDTVPQTQFVDQAGHRFTFADFRGKDVVLAFIYTRCRDPRECPLISSTYHSLQSKIAGQPYHLVEITLDPAYDRPAILAAYAKQFEADPSRWTLGTGEPQDVRKFAAQFGIDPFYDSHIGLIHTERTALIDRTGRIVDLADEAGWNADGMLSRLNAIESLPENPLARLDYELSKAAVAVCGNSVAGFSGLADLGIVLLIFGAGAYLLIRVARGIFKEEAK
jgi:cytochrome oxidase Cu insertion factor (SCO1/SenC/PrrC family)